jgi:hypothetical protein
VLIEPIAQDATGNRTRHAVGASTMSYSYPGSSDRLEQFEQRHALSDRRACLSWILTVPARRRGEIRDPVEARAEGFERPEGPSATESTRGAHRPVVAHAAKEAADLTA